MVKSVRLTKEFVVLATSFKSRSMGPYCFTDDHPFWDWHYVWRALSCIPH